MEIMWIQHAGELWNTKERLRIYLDNDCVCFEIDGNLQFGFVFHNETDCEFTGGIISGAEVFFQEIVDAVQNGKSYLEVDNQLSTMFHKKKPDTSNDVKIYLK